MNFIKRITAYFFWVILALGAGIAYMWVLLGSFREYVTGKSQLLRIFHDLAVFHVGLVVGGVIALLFILVDVLYLKRKAGRMNSTAGRFVAFFAVGIFVFVMHYVLEKLIDVI